MVNDSTLELVVGAFGLPESPRSGDVSKESVLAWAKHPDIEVLGAVYTYITDSRYSHRIKPSLSFAEYNGLVLRYFERCIRENPDGEWSDSSHIAGYDAASWFRHIWRFEEVPESVAGEFKAWLAHLFLSSNETIRLCIVNAILEHLFEDPSIATYFEDWKCDKELARAYAMAKEWSSE